jgi:serine/threonine-protein kinase ULK/ATG1
MAPEILRYEKYDAKADLWSVGAVLFEMSVGKPPFRAQNHVDLLRKIERGEDRIKFPDDKKQEDGSDRLMVKVGLDIKTLIRRLLKRNPTERMNFEDFFPEANRVAEGGGAEKLTSAEKVSAQYAKLSTTLSPSVPSPSTRTPLSIPISPILSEAAFISHASLANANRPSRSSSTPSPPQLIPPVPQIPAYIDQERPAFARQWTSEIAAHSVPPPPSSVRRSPKVASRENTPALESRGLVDGIKARDFAVTKAVGRTR